MKKWLINIIAGVIFIGWIPFLVVSLTVEVFKVGFEKADSWGNKILDKIIERF